MSPNPAPPTQYAKADTIRAPIWNARKGQGVTGYRRHIPDHKVISRNSRLNNPTLAEKILFQGLQSLRPLGFIFRRERMVLGWCLDFYCAKRRLAVEVDGGYHLSRQGQDAKRDYILGLKLSIQTLRFSNEQVIENVSDVIQRILTVARSRKIFRSWNHGTKKAISDRRNAGEPEARGRRAVTLAGKAAMGART